MKKKNNEIEKDEREKDKIIKIILIIIIILLLIHNCSLIQKKNKGTNGNVNIIDINCNDDKCIEEKEELPVDCLEDENNNICLVPNFIGDSKRDVLKWLSSISNTINVEFKTTRNPDYEDGTVIEQSIIGLSIKDLISSQEKLEIVIINNGSLIDCQNNNKSSKCVIPNFVGKNKNSVIDWLGDISINVKIKYVYVDSNRKLGTIIKQSVKSGNYIKDIIDKDETIIIYVSNGSKLKSPDTSNDNYQGDSTTDDSNIDDGDFYVSDNEKVKWQNEINLKIFEDSNSISKVKGKIAPESKGTYKFVVNNETKYNLKYKINFIENNKDNINMKYKLKKGDSYLIENYVSYDKLNINNMSLNSKSSETYYLEWKWIGDNDSNDTKIGIDSKSENVEYKLKIDIEAESV